MIFRENLEKMANIYGGIPVYSVEKGSSSHRAGVRAGDILVAVNGRKVRKVSDYVCARSQLPRLLEIVVVREGKVRTLSTRPDRAGLGDTLPTLTCGWLGNT